MAYPNELEPGSAGGYAEVEMLRTHRKRRVSFWARVRDYRWLLLMILPAVLLQLAFSYVPMAGMLMAFRNVDEFHLPFGTKWVGFANFQFLTDIYFWQTVRNTLVIAGTKFV
ncbi:MAG TPA: sugar ABC transporter permease, partial [Bacillota bacterium]